MIYDAITQETMDIDWFMVDRDGYIAHLASGGNVLPKSVAISVEDNEALLNFFLSQKDISEVQMKKMYSHNASSFIRMAKKGLFSFDRLKPSDCNCTTYRKVVLPLVPLRIETLPSEIVDILSRTRTDQILFSQTDILDWATIIQ
jgi:hypothetical protein